MATDHIDELLDRARFPTREAVEDHLLAQFVPDAYTPRPAESWPTYSLERARPWLACIAYHMYRANTRDLACWDIPYWMPFWRRVIATGVTSGLASATLFAVVGVLEGRLAVGLVTGMLVGLVAAVFDAHFVSGEQIKEQRGMGLLIGGGFVVGSTVVGSLAGGLQGGIDDGTEVGAGAGLVSGLVGLLAVVPAVHGLRFSGRPAAAKGRPLNPEASWQQDRRQSRILGPLVGLTFAITLGVVTVLVGESMTRAVSISALALGLVTAFAFVFSARVRTVLTLLQLWPRHRCPLDLIGFLEEARRRNVLRTAGPVYQFRHARVQDVLARWYAEDQGLPFDAPDRLSDG